MARTAVNNDAPQLALNTAAPPKSIAARDAAPPPVIPSLQTTLDIEKLIRIFAAETKRCVEYKGLAYRRFGTATDDEISLGEPGIHSCTYTLIVEDQPLGEMRLTRDQPFVAEELVVVEGLLTGLLYPLRNAVMYQDALGSALKDPLTLLYNRAALNASMDHEILVARRDRSPLTLLMLDVDRFKSINDNHGHVAGDITLLALAQCLVQSVRAADIVARYGGEEFSVLLLGANTEHAMISANRILQRITKTQFRHNDAVIPVTVSIGAASLRTGDDRTQLTERADRALYQAKREGGNCIRMLHD